MVWTPTDLVLDALYTGPLSARGYPADPLNALLGVSSRGGFRYLGSRQDLQSLNLIVLTSHFNDPEWPDRLDPEKGTLTYFGDNKKPGRRLHDTPRGGNSIFRSIFEADMKRRQELGTFPVILGFAHARNLRAMQFLGVLVPGSPEVSQQDWLTATWRTTRNKRFQNYRAVFSVLDIAEIGKSWIGHVREGRALESEFVPRIWSDWVLCDKWSVLRSPKTRETRSKTEQLPDGKADELILDAIREKFRENPYGFERCATEIARLLMPSISRVEVTRKSGDGGRDAVGIYRLGGGESAVNVEFSLEAKCYGPGNSVGTRELSRLISRLRHRQFGILVTTSFVATQAYKEIVEDRHPIVLICASDIAQLLRDQYGDLRAIESWLGQFD